MTTIRKEDTIMENKPDDRSNNVDRIEYNIGKTMENIRLANEMIELTSDEKTKEELMAKNERREKAIEGMREEIKDEAMAQKDGYQ